MIAGMNYVDGGHQKQSSIHYKKDQPKRAGRSFLEKNISNYHRLIKKLKGPKSCNIKADYKLPFGVIILIEKIIALWNYAIIITCKNLKRM